MESEKRIFLRILPLSLLIIGANFYQGSAARQVRRSDIRQALASKMDPNFWPTRGRRSESLQPMQMYLQQATKTRGVTNSEEEGPFWANRGRSILFPWDMNLYEDITKEEPFAGGNSSDRPDADEDDDLLRNILFADEPGWLPMPSRTNLRQRDVKSDDTFWVSRGKKFDETRNKREIPKMWDRFNYWNWIHRNRRNGSKLSRALDNLKAIQFWPSRGKKDAHDS